jgi:hypothetical protein
MASRLCCCCCAFVVVVRFDLTFLRTLVLKEEEEATIVVFDPKVIA